MFCNHATYLLLALLFQCELRFKALACLKEGGSLLALVEEEAHNSNSVDAEHEHHEGPQLSQPGAAAAADITLLWAVARERGVFVRCWLNPSRIQAFGT